MPLTVRESRSSRASRARPRPSRRATAARASEAAPRRFLTRAPFAVQTRRFVPLGYHPDLDRAGTMTTDRSKPAVGQYEPRDVRCLRVERKSLWDRSLDSEEFSANLGFRNAEILRERCRRRAAGGPGSHDVPDAAGRRASASVAADVGFGTARRFGPRDRAAAAGPPPPGAYSAGLLRYEPRKCRLRSTVPTFERDGFVDRFRALFRTGGTLPPNRYSPIDPGSVANRLRQASRKKLPYCLFSGERDGTSIKNHFSPPIDATPDKYYDHQEGFDYLLHHPDKRRAGRFLRDQRFPVKPTLRMLMNDLSTCYKDPEAPSPAHYDVKIDSIRKLPENKYPFNDSKPAIRGGLNWTTLPGPGRYPVREYRCNRHNDKRLSCVFKSTTGRTEYKTPVYSYF